MKITFQSIREKTRFISPILSMVALLVTLTYYILFIVAFSEMGLLDETYISSFTGSFVFLIITIAFVIMNFVKPDMKKTISIFGLLLLIFSNHFESIVGDNSVYMFGIAIGYDLVAACFVTLVISFVLIGLACILTFVNAIFLSMSVKLHYIPLADITKKDNRIALENTLDAFQVSFVKQPFFILMIKNIIYIAIEILVVTANNGSRVQYSIEYGVVGLSLCILCVSIIIVYLINKYRLSLKKKLLITSIVYSVFIVSCVIGIICSFNMDHYRVYGYFACVCGSYIIISLMGLALSLFSLIVLRNTKDYYNDALIIQ